MASRFRFTTAFVFDGGYVEATEITKDGKPLTHTMTLSPGVIDMGGFDKMLTYFDLKFHNIFLSDNSGRISQHRSEGHGETASTPNWQPSSQLVAQREMRRIAAEMVEAADKKRSKLLRRERREERRLERQEQRALDVPEGEAETTDQPEPEEVPDVDNQSGDET